MDDTHTQSNATADALYGNIFTWSCYMMDTYEDHEGLGKRKEKK